MAAASELRSLRELALLHHVQLSYRDAFGRRRRAGPDALVAVLRALGAQVDAPADAAGALRERRERLAGRSRGLEPVVVSWEGEPCRVPVVLPAGKAESLRVQLKLEQGGCRPCRVSGREPGGAADTVRMRVRVPGGLPYGYHRLVADADGWNRTSTVVAAPGRARAPAPGRRGVYAPLYALRSDASLGAGNLSDLVELGAWLSDAGAGAVAILPLLASYLDEPFEPSPYAPVSRRLWNELYLDLERAPGLDGSAEARTALGAARRGLASRGREQYLNYREQASATRSVLAPLAEHAFGEPGLRSQLETFLAANPLVAEYARFRGVVERHGAGWRRWPERLGAGDLRDADGATRRLHAYAQWALAGQVERARGALSERGVALLLDLPLGVHPDGFDAWREQHLFLSGVTVGAPPDPFFTRGQDWGFAPIDPEAARADGHAYFRACLAHHLAAADGLRLDHVMALHRLFVVPVGMAATEGVYVRYPADELYAIACLESHRHSAHLVGENLGTVPAYVDTAMRRHGLSRMYVLELALEPGEHNSVRPPGPGTLASLNTHDMPTFAAFWRADDVDDRVALGLLDGNGARIERANRARLRSALVRRLAEEGLLRPGEERVEEVLAAALAYLGASEAEVALVNLEDLWLETAPQNTPGTTDERPNWRRSARRSLEELRADRQIAARLRALLTGSTSAG